MVRRKMSNKLRLPTLNLTVILCCSILCSRVPSVGCHQPQLTSISSRHKQQSSLGEFLMTGKQSVQSRTSLASQTARPAASDQATSQPPPVDEYKCAQFCSCSIVQVLDPDTRELMANLTQARCENFKFADILTIDRRTQIIHISLPNDQDSVPNYLADSVARRVSQSSFRMPRMVQFGTLRELAMINFRFQVCDSEVFKRGQKLRRFRLNHNQLSRISKACLRHLDRLMELNLDHNNLSELESALFSSLLNLRVLSIAHNKLEDLAAHQFANLTQLISLNLVGNMFKMINLHLFEPMAGSLRVLILARNLIKSFVHQIPAAAPAPLAQQVGSAGSNTSLRQQPLVAARAAPFAGVVFKNLIKLNVDHNQVERIKLLQLHRFFNVKFLSIRHNNIATIRDKAFNGLKLIELNLAHNKLITIAKCSFCNATIKRLVLASNNITIPLPSSLDSPSAQTSRLPDPAALIQGDLSLSAVAPPLPTIENPPQQPAPQQQPSSSQNVLILSQSILGPLFSQLEYLDLSHNEQLADQLDMLIEPLLKLRYLNLANSGIDRSLPTPNLFKNLHQLKYLNLSHNQLDQVISETIEPLTNLEVLDLSHNKFSEIDESFLVTLDDLSLLRIIRLGPNPWFCSQCKVIHLYDWMLRSPVYNATCIAPSLAQQEANQLSSGSTDSDDSDSGDDVPANGNMISAFGLNFTDPDQERQDYSLLVGPDDSTSTYLAAADIDFALMSSQPPDGDESYNIYQPENQSLGVPVIKSSLHSLLKRLATSEDDESIAITMATILSGYVPKVEYCSKCEFPGELRAFGIHELSPGDFKYCPGSGLRVNASDPKIGLTLAIVIIGALFCIIVVVIIMYRKKSNAYYPGEDTDHLGDSNNQSSGGGRKQPVFSISSDGEHQYGDNTDYSSPPMSQSFESFSGSPEDEELELEDEDEDEEITDEEEEEEADEEEDYGDDTARGGQHEGKHDSLTTDGPSSSNHEHADSNRYQGDKNQTEVKQLMGQSSPMSSSAGGGKSTLSGSKSSGSQGKLPKPQSSSAESRLGKQTSSASTGADVRLTAPQVAEDGHSLQQQKSIMKPTTAATLAKRHDEAEVTKNVTMAMEPAPVQRVFRHTASGDSSSRHQPQRVKLESVESIQSRSGRQATGATTSSSGGSGELRSQPRAKIRAAKTIEHSVRLRPTIVSSRSQSTGGSKRTAQRDQIELTLNAKTLASGEAAANGNSLLTKQPTTEPKHSAAGKRVARPGAGDRAPPPAVSADEDATSADSIAIEALGYLAGSDEPEHLNRVEPERATPSGTNLLSLEPPTGGALVEVAESPMSGDYGLDDDDDETSGREPEANSDSADELERLAAGEHSQRIQRLASRRHHLRQPSASSRHLRPSTSTHSALTQTGSLNNEEATT